jgi:hypothetical protein
VTLDEARKSIGRTVVYTPPAGDPETGVITSTSTTMVFVRYGGDNHAKATNPADLTLLDEHVRASQKPAESHAVPTGFPPGCDAHLFGGAASVVDGHCRCVVCPRCGHHTGNAHQGHYWA